MRHVVSFPLTDPLVRIELPTREELRRMLTRPAVVITAIVCATLIVLTAIGGVIFLVYSGKDSSAIGILIAAIAGAGATLVGKRLGDVRRDVAEIKQNQVS